jgi:hypothetical protein
MDHRNMTEFPSTISSKTPMLKSETNNQGWTENTLATRKKTNNELQNNTHKTKTKQQGPTKNRGRFQMFRKCKQFLSPLVASVVLL